MVGVTQAQYAQLSHVQSVRLLYPAHDGHILASFFCDYLRGYDCSCCRGSLIVSVPVTVNCGDREFVIGHSDEPCPRCIVGEVTCECEALPI
jgi:hypothetical protein